MMDIEDIVTSPVQTEQCPSLASSIIRTPSAPLPRASASVAQDPSQTPRRQVVTFQLPGEVDPTIQLPNMSLLWRSIKNMSLEKKPGQK
ncbi:hypothetical protein I4U23_000019 [Adineta vaga]|nr:hypothetical protein I4U23_000019 [Adineta vaga]